MKEQISLNPRIRSWAVLIFFLVCHSQKSFGQVTTPTFSSGAGQACANSVVQGNTLCFNQAGKNEIGASGAAETAVNGSDATSSIDGASTGQAIAQVGVALASANANLCHKATESCLTSCKAAETDIMTRLTTMASTPGGQAQIPILKRDMIEVKKTIASCAQVFGGRTKLFISQVGVNSVTGAQMNEALKAMMGTEYVPSATEAVSDFVSNNSGKIALGTMAAAYLVNRNKSGGGGGESADDLARAAAADPTCQSSQSYKFSHCQKYLTALCAQPAQMNDARCVSYLDNYCGVGAKAGQAANGLGTQVCQDTLAQRYCQGANRSGCYSCLDLRDRSTALCQSQPAACAKSPTDSQMREFKSTCPDDPVFAQTRWAHLAPTTQTASAQSQSFSAIGNSSTLASQAPSSVAVTNRSILALNAAVLVKLCQEGHLQNCK